MEKSGELESTPPPPVFSWVHVTQSLVLCECFVDRCLSFGHCVVYYTVARTSYSSTVWSWHPLCSKIACLVGTLVLAHWKNSPRVDMSVQSNTIWANHSVLLLIFAWPDRILNPHVVVTITQLSTQTHILVNVLFDSYGNILTCMSIYIAVFKPLSTIFQLYCGG